MSNKNPVRVLVAEDDFLVSEDIVRHLKQKNYHHIGTACNGEKAISMVKELKPDVVLMDIKMPEMDGLKATSIIQAECPTPVVILSAHESADILAQASEAGAGAFLTKPSNPEEIDRAIVIALARHQDLLKSMELIKQLETHKKELQEINAQKDKLFSIIAHDLRSPFIAIMGYSEMLSRDYYSFPDADRQKFISSINESVKNTFSLLDNLLNWSRSQRDKLDLNFQNYNLFELVNKVTGTLKARAEQKEIIIKNIIPKEINLRIDYDTISIVFSNLIGNAIKFTSSGGKIEISAIINGPVANITVADTGMGIDQNKLKDLFNIEKLVSTPGTENEQGTGLGLILCKEFIEKNKGMLEVNSRLNLGSKFIIKLPV